MGTATHIRDTAGMPERSRAVSPLIGSGLRRGDVDSTILRRTTATTPGARTSTTATRIGTTRTTRTRSSSSAKSFLHRHAAFSFRDLHRAYYNCRSHKRRTKSALRFEIGLETNLFNLWQALVSGTYSIGRSICFAITHPKPREVWAAEFIDRIVQWLLINKIADRFYRSFIADSCACIPGRSTLYAAERLEAKVRSVTQNWSRPAYYLKCDIANFFVSIDKSIVFELLAKRIPEHWWLELTRQILWHDPRHDYETRGSVEDLAKVPRHKRLAEQPHTHGLPIGNLSSQFFANVLMDVLDQFIKHRLGVRHYIRYVDDFVLLHESPQVLNAWLSEIMEFLPARLHLELNTSKTILQPIPRGVDFVGQIVKPWRRCLRRRTLRYAELQVAKAKPADLLATTNSYLGLCRQASKSHNDQARICRAAWRRGHSVEGDLSKIHRRKAA